MACARPSIHLTQLVAVQLPIGSESDLTGLVDLVEMKVRMASMTTASVACLFTKSILLRRRCTSMAIKAEMCVLGTFLQTCSTPQKLIAWR
jgi:hypothetical protein